MERLKEKNERTLLSMLSANVEATRRLKNKKHEVWQSSFDWKHCETEAFIQQKLTYMHNNPCSKKWMLAENPVSYRHSSAKFYSTGSQGDYPVSNAGEMKDVEFYRDK